MNEHLANFLVPVPKCQADDCANQEAFFYQMQTRSADEPPTSFYRVRPQVATIIESFR
jgi:DNA-directed RNA polymerase subunit M/transcription elongation factor TFIIS